MLRAEALEDIPEAHFGANGVHKEMMQIGKMDQVAISIANVRDKDMNPLAELSILLDLKMVKPHPQIEFEDDGMTLKLNEEVIIQEVQKQYKNKFINNKESFII
jgi:hypothetical protein